MKYPIRLLALVPLFLHGETLPAAEPRKEEVLPGMKRFFEQTARPDGSFQPGIDPDYPGMSDSAYSDLAPTVYAVVLHKTFGWKLPHEEKTIAFLLARQQSDGAFVNVKGTADPKSPQARAYNTTQGLVALHALGVKPKYDPLPVFDVVLKEDYKKMPLYMTSFFPLAYLTMGKKIPVEADRKIRALMAEAQGEDGYLGEHVASSFHAVHYYRLIGEKTPKGESMLQRVLKEQHANGGWYLNPPSRDRHATFDAVFTIRHLGGKGKETSLSLSKASQWILKCRNEDGGFGHYPGSPSDADAVYFHVAALVMTNVLAPVDPLPANAQLFGWGHLMPCP